MRGEAVGQAESPGGTWVQCLEKPGIHSVVREEGAP